jgi:tRNA dimethylallyltransferase
VNAEPLLAVILGPTGSGKTALSLALAREFGGEIVSCDSVAVYRQFEIGTAKPSRQDRARVPHHLIDVADPRDPFTAGEYARRGREALREISQRGKLPIVVGGTGLYLRALLEGLAPAPQRSEQLRERLRKRTEKPGHLHRVLKRLDAKSAAAIHANDAPKLIRAIEVCLTARKPMAEVWQDGREPLTGFRILRIGLDPDRAALYERINGRAQKMFENGLVDETQALLPEYAGTMPMGSLGYREASQLLRGELTREQAITAAQQGHRNYAKRQMTWFRREPEVKWLNGFGNEAATQHAAAELIRQQQL